MTHYILTEEELQIILEAVRNSAVYADIELNERVETLGVNSDLTKESYYRVEAAREAYKILISL